MNKRQGSGEVLMPNRKLAKTNNAVAILNHGIGVIFRFANAKLRLTDKTKHSFIHFTGHTLTDIDLKQLNASNLLYGRA